MGNHEYTGDPVRKIIESGAPWLLNVGHALNPLKIGHRALTNSANRRVRPALFAVVRERAPLAVVVPKPPPTPEGAPRRPP